MSFNTLECFADLPDLFSADSEAMIAATARHREISSLEFSSTSLEPTGKSEFSKSARFGYERAEHYDIEAPKFLSRLTVNLLLQEGYRCASQLLSASQTRFFCFHAVEKR